MTRAKFVCQSVRKFQSTVWDKAGQNPTPGLLYEYEFNVVHDGSPENKVFFASTPSGIVKLACVRDGLFEPGKAYYLDFSPAEA